MVVESRVQAEKYNTGEQIYCSDIAYQ